MSADLHALLQQYGVVHATIDLEVSEDEEAKGDLTLDHIHATSKKPQNDMGESSNWIEQPTVRDDVTQGVGSCHRIPDTPGGPSQAHPTPAVTHLVSHQTAIGNAMPANGTRRRETVKCKP